MLAVATLCLFFSQLIGLLKTSNPIPANCKVLQINSLRAIIYSYPQFLKVYPCKSNSSLSSDREICSSVLCAALVY